MKINWFIPAMPSLVATGYLKGLNVHKLKLNEIRNSVSQHSSVQFSSVAHTVITSTVFLSHARLLDWTIIHIVATVQRFPRHINRGNSHAPSHILNDSKQEKTAGLHLQQDGTAYSTNPQGEQNFICQWAQPETVVTQPMRSLHTLFNGLFGY